MLVFISIDFIGIFTQLEFRTNGETLTLERLLNQASILMIRRENRITQPKNFLGAECRQHNRTAYTTVEGQFCSQICSTHFAFIGTDFSNFTRHKENHSFAKANATAQEGNHFRSTGSLPNECSNYSFVFFFLLLLFLQLLFFFMIILL